jgi:hypothetical protein
MQQPREPPLGHKGQTEKLNKIVRLNHLQSNRIGDQFLARFKHQVPDGQDDAVIAVMFLTHSRVVGAMEIGRDDDVGQPLLTGERQIRMVKKHEGHSEHLADDDDLSADADQDDANAFHDDFQKLVKNVKPQPSRDMTLAIKILVGRIEKNTNMLNIAASRHQTENQTSLITKYE